MPVHDLDEDILAHILLISDIYTILSFARVNKSFRRLALSKHLWLSLVLDLSSRYFIPDAHGIHDCTTSQLIAKMVGSFQAGSIFVARLGSGNIQCCEVLTGNEVWTHAPKNGSFSSWEVEMLHDGHTAIFVFHDPLPIGLRQEFLIVQVDLTTGHSNELCHLEFNTDAGLFYSPIISGDLLALGLTMGRERMIVVVNWRERKYAVFASEYSDASPNNYMTLVAGHIILAAVAHEPPHDLRILVYILHSMASRWRSLEELFHNTGLPAEEIRIRPEDISPIMVERLEHNGRVFTDPYPRVVMRLYANPIRHDAYKLIVYASDSVRSRTNIFKQTFGEASRPVFFTYALNVGAGIFS
ncbi:hypothetical protein MSAN_02425000 [Mycena sanguinolenta]|uniref:F-box domain-containing protein n=1 Tax=Mycena sanguinolenta TaxID=230812 RepID=A0A8H6X2Z5_9AGAR|nr:hypothetical protein MSAN_02425000 [Mycena sanguinolenta]